MSKIEAALNSILIGMRQLYLLVTINETSSYIDVSNQVVGYTYKSKGPICTTGIIQEHHVGAHCCLFAE